MNVPTTLAEIQATPPRAALPAARHSTGLLGLAALLVVVLADVSILHAQYVQGGFYASRGFYDSDWLVFYRAAERLRDGANPYEIQAQFLNPPSFLLLMRAAIVLPYMPSRIIWSVASALMLLAAVPLTAAATGWRPAHAAWPRLAVAVLAYTPTVLLIPVAANTTAPVVLCYALAFRLFVRGHEGRAGAALCVATLIKPQLALLLLPLLLYKRRWRAAAAYLATAATVLAISLAVEGPATFANFLRMERAASGWADSATLWIRDIPGLHAAALQAFPGSGLAAGAAYALSTALLGALARFWQGPWRPDARRFAIGWAMLPLVDLLIAPYSHSDDLTLLIVPAVILCALAAQTPGAVAPVAGGRDKQRQAPEARAMRAVPLVLAGLYLAPMLVVFFRQHFMVPAILAALWVLWRCGKVGGD